MTGIYRIENLINHKNYIGQSVRIDARWNAHMQLAFEPSSISYNYPLYKAIRKYGLENFNFTILEECLEQELDEKEIYWIKIFDSYGKHGYNQTSGGSGYRKAPPEQVITLFTKGYSVEDLCLYFDVSKTTIIEILHNANLGYMTQEEKNKIQPACKIVEQYDLDGNLLNIYYSEGAAAKSIRASRPAISNTCRTHGTVNGYIWKFQNDNFTGKQIAEKLKIAEQERKEKVITAVQERCSKKVNQYTCDGKYLKTYSSVTDAGRSLGKSHGCIARVCRGEGKLSYGFIWKYVSDEYPVGKDLDKSRGG